ncbi:MAG: ROK family protein [Eubacteriales bacterium]|nr:ROK family protein [Eubacteriales bacterium]
MKTLVFDIGGTSIKYGSCIDGTLSEVKETPTEAKKGGRHIMETVASLITREQGYDAIGISTAGQVDASAGTIIYANSNIPAYTGTRIKEELEGQFHVPVAVENDVNAAAMGEAVCGAGRDCPDFLCLTYGTGVGGAIVLNGEIFHGSSFSAAEFGAIVTHSEEKLRQKDFFDGCYERYASTTALVQRAVALDPSLDSGRKIFENLHRPEVAGILDGWVDEILLGLSSLIHIFNPSCVILGGGVMAQPLILEMIRARIGRFVMPSFAHVSIRTASLGNTAGLLGADCLASRLIRNEQKEHEKTT